MHPTKETADPGNRSKWAKRKAASANYATQTVHLTQHGVWKLDALYELMRTVFDTGNDVLNEIGCRLDMLNSCVNTCGGPTKAGTLEWGLNLVLDKLGVRPADIVSAHNKGKPYKDVFREANEKRAAAEAKKAGRLATSPGTRPGANAEGSP